MRRYILIAILFTLVLTGRAQQVRFDQEQIRIGDDPMEWLLKTNGTQYAWVTEQYQWGKIYYDADGEIVVSKEKRQDGDDLAVYHYYALATGSSDYLEKARHIVQNNLSHFFEDGKATCAFVYPRRVNGEPAHYADAYANDQDWALMYWLLVNEKK